MYRALFSALLAAGLAGCYLGSGTPGGGSQDTGGGGPGAEAAVVKPTGLPCAVADLLTKYCLACHGPSPSSGTSLASMSDLKKTSTDPSKNEAQLALARMQAGTMPPQGSTRPSAAEIAAFASWVGSGLPAGSCLPPDGGGGPDPFAGPHVCTSGSYYKGGEGSTMQPGNPCISCHATSGEAPRYSIAGTVYPTGHEPSGCQATGESGAQVAITDSSNQVRLYSVNSVGNFSGRDAIAFPYRAEVRYAGKVRAMATAQNDGDCNVCHAENGTNGAPGRILLAQ